MAQKLRGEIELVIGQKTYTLRPSYAATVEFEDKAGITVFEAMKALGDRQSMPIKSMRCVFHSCIKAAWKPSMGTIPTPDEIGEAVHNEGVSNFITPYAKILSNMLTGELALARAEEATEPGKPT